MNIDFIVNILIHMFIILSVLTLLFWNVISKKETSIITNEFVNNINNGFESLDETLNPYQKDRITKVVNNIRPGLNIFKKYFSKPDKTFVAKNKCLKDSNFRLLIMFIILILTVCIIYHFSAKSDVHIFTILKENLIIFAIIGIFEYIFFKNIADYFIPIKPSYLSEMIHKQIHKRFSI